MAVFNTIEELIEILDGNPQWIEALRARLLTRELLELPEKFAEFAETTNRRLDSLDQRLDQFIKKVDKYIEKTDERLASFEQRHDQFDQFIKKVDKYIEITDRRFNKMDRDHARFRAAHARTAAIRQAPGIASDMGFQWTRNLSMHHLLRMIANGDTTGIDSIDLRKFRNADLIIEAVDAQDKTHYIAVEISYTADARDTDRAIMFAGFLKKFTGRNTHAAIAALNIDNRIRNITQSGDVFWYRLEDYDLEVN